jgi:hypothetical protein
LLYYHSLGTTTVSGIGFSQVGSPLLQQWMLRPQGERSELAAVAVIIAHRLGDLQPYIGHGRPFSWDGHLFCSSLFFARLAGGRQAVGRLMNPWMAWMDGQMGDWRGWMGRWVDGVNGVDE